MVFGNIDRIWLWMDGWFGGGVVGGIFDFRLEWV